MTPDVLVVGGGPAGSATATRLARLGHRVLLVDRARFPRDKACGECLNPAAVRALAQLGSLEGVLRRDHAPLAGWSITNDGGLGFEGRFPAGERGIAIARRELDEELLGVAERAGVEVWTGRRVVEPLLLDAGVRGVRLEGGESVRARLVVGADGLRSVIVRRLGLLRRGPRLRKLALTAHVRGIQAPRERGELRLLASGACVGLAAVGEGVSNVTVVLTGAGGRRVAGGREACFDALLGSVEALRGGVRVGPVLATGPFDWPIRSAVADGALLVGDAAGYYDPFTGQGIYRALRGAELAAESAHAALTADDLSAAALAPYERARRAAFSPGERVQRLVEAFVSRPPLMRWVSARLRARPAVADRLIAVTGDLLPARSLLEPAMLAGLLR